MLRGNLVGLAMIVISALAVIMGKTVLKLDDATTMILVGGTLIVVDVLVRLRSRGRAGWLTQRQFGGHLFSIPIWGVGGIVVAANLIKTLTEQA